MRCKCGFDFAESDLRAIRTGKKGHDNFAVVRDNIYPEFLTSERRITTFEPGSQHWLDAVSESSLLVSQMAQCPDCGRMALSDVDSDSLRFFVPET